MPRIPSTTTWQAYAHRERHGHAIFTRLGPGLVAGASDIDPTTVATMAVVGVTTVYALSWLTWLLVPVLTVMPG